MVYSWRSFIITIIDAFLVIISMYLALLMRFDGLIPVMYLDNFLRLVPFTTVVMMISFFVFGLYRRAWEYASIGELVAVVEGVMVGSIINAGIAYVINGYAFPLPRSVFILNIILRIVLIGGSRVVWRVLRDNRLGKKKNCQSKPVLIFGAGDAGVLVAKELKSHYNGGVQIVGFVDDDIKKQNMIVQGINVMGRREDIPKLVKKHKIQEVIIAMPSVEGWIKRRIVGICQDADVKVKILPGVYDLIDGKVKVNKIREVQVEDLLGREPVEVDLDDITQYIRNQVVLVTGGGGSIGSELCRQVARYQPKALLILDA
ncbi:MAG: polysaccharide biosynthesis protein, partial [Dehalobacterium sp.]